MADACHYDFSPPGFFFRYKWSCNCKLVEFCFWSTIKFLEFSILVLFEHLKSEQNLNSNNFIITWPHHLRSSNIVHLQWFEIEQTRNFEQFLIIWFRERFVWIKIETAYICVTRLPPSNPILDQKVYPRVLSCVKPNTEGCSQICVELGSNVEFLYINPDICNTISHWLQFTLGVFKFGRCKYRKLPTNTVFNHMNLILW